MKRYVFLILLLVSQCTWATVSQKQQYQIIYPGIFPINSEEWVLEIVVSDPSSGIEKLKLTSFADMKCFLQPIGDMLFLTFDLGQYPNEVAADDNIHVFISWTGGKTSKLYSAGNVYIAGKKSSENLNVFKISKGEGLELQEEKNPVLSVLSCIGKERSAASTFLATVSNVPADFLNKGYRIDWGDSGITTGAVKGAGPYEVTGHIGENFEAPAGEMKVKLLKDTSTVAEANLLPRAGIISVPDKEYCYGMKGEKIAATVSLWGSGCFIRWLDNSYHEESRLVAINDTEVEIRGDFPAGTHTLWAWLFDSTGDIISTTRFTLTVIPGLAAPQVSIDTNTNRLDIKIHWTPVSDATAYHVYSRKWDPYCLTSENGGTYTKTAVTSTSYIRSAANVASDTLAFFYVTATNGTCESSASDTVGYKLDNLLVNVGKTSNNMVSWMFDMTGKGIISSGDCFRLIKKNLKVLRKWDIEMQSWKTATVPNTRWDGIDPNEPEFKSEFDLLIGNVYQFDVVKGTKLLQYGKLPEPFEFNLNKGNASSAITLAFLQPYRADLYSSDEMFSEIEELLFIRYWNFENQDWRFSYKEEGEIIGTFRLRPILMPLQIELVNGASGPVKWK